MGDFGAPMFSPIRHDSLSPNFFEITGDPESTAES